MYIGDRTLAIRLSDLAAQGPFNRAAHGVVAAPRGVAHALDHLNHQIDQILRRFLTSGAVVEPAQGDGRVGHQATDGVEHDGRRHRAIMQQLTPVADAFGVEGFELAAVDRQIAGRHIVDDFGRSRRQPN